MSQLPDPVAVIDPGEEARLELSAAAAAAERANRPLLPVILGAVLLAIAIVYALRAGAGLTAARLDIGRQQSMTAEVQGLVTELRNLTDPHKSELNDPDPGAQAKLEQLASAAGLPARPKFEIRATDDRSAPPGTKRWIYSASIKGAEASPLIQWITEATGDNSANLKGMEVGQIKLVPAKGPGAGGQWDADIVLTRLERGS